VPDEAVPDEAGPDEGVDSGVVPGAGAGRLPGEPGRLRLRVVDAGPGVPESDWERMFTPFERLTHRPGGDGAGLGLAIARGFAEAMDATLTPSRTPGGGLTMTLTLPVAAR
jgi:two-component system sensor histidine kinase KdpD